MYRKTILMAAALLLLSMSGLFAEVWTTSIISSNTTWAKDNSTGDGVYVVDLTTDTLVVQSGVTLTIEPGVTVKMHDDITFLIYGTLDAQGTATDSVIFTLDDASGSATEWGGIKVIPSDSSYHSIVSYCRIEYGDADGTSLSDPAYKKNGGGIFFGDNTTSGTSLSHAVIQNNHAIEGGGGIGIAGAPNINSCVVRDNSADQYGGGISLKGPSPTVVANPAMNNMLIYNNSANGSGGGGIALFSGAVLNLKHGLIYANESPNGKGGGLYLYSATTVANVVNSLIGENTADSDAQVSGVANITYSNVQGGSSGEGNIDEDPEFIDPDNYNFHFKANSPLVDAGDNDNSSGLDFEGNSRPFDGDRNGTASVDMGPYEYQNTDPQITSDPATEATEDQLYTYQVVAADPDTNEVLTYSLTTAPSFLSIDASTGLISGTPSTDAQAGVHSVTVQVADLNNATDTQTYDLTVTAVNDAPVVSGIPDQTVNEGESFVTIALDDYVTDEDNTDAEMTWSYSGNTQLAVSIDENRVATITIPDTNWYGSESITFTATDPGGLTGSDAATFTVNNINDAPVVSDIPDQTIDEGGSFTTISLDDYVTDIDNVKGDLTWSYSGNSELSVSIDENRVATITTPNADWYGAETVTFTCTDPGGLSDADPATFTVNAVNDAPVVSDIPDQTIDEGGSFVSIDLDTYVSDVDNEDSELTWTYSGNSDLIVAISGDHVATITTPNADWNGAETVTFTATDPGDLSDSDAAVFTVNNINDKPVAVNDTVTTDEDVAATIHVLSNDTDIDNDALTVQSITTPAHGTAEIQNDTLIVYTSVADWNGSDSFSYTISDGNGGADTAEVFVTVNAVNDAPVVTDIPDQSIEEAGTFTTIALDNYVSDVDNSDSEMTWSYSGNSDLTVSIDENHVATISIPDTNWYGSEEITFTASDPGGLSGNDAAIFSVTNVNDAPVVSEIPGQTIDEGASFATIALDDYVSDVDNADDEMVWSVSGNTDLQISIDANRVATIAIPDSNWFGSENLTFTATDPGGLKDSSGATFTVNAVNDAPVVSDIPDQTITEGGSFTAIMLDNYVSDVDNADSTLTWSFSGNANLTIQISSNHVATISVADSNWNGSEEITFTATDPGGLNDSDAATFTVNAVNDAPVVSNIPGQTIDEGGSFATIALDDYISDVDNADDEMVWSVSGNTDLQISIDANRVATIAIPDSNWFGSENLTFTATDPGGLKDSSSATFTVNAVNDAPVITGLNGQIVPEGTAFEPIALDAYVTDVDNADSSLVWTVKGAIDLKATITDRVLTVDVPSADWNGKEALTLTVTDPGSLTDSVQVVFEVTPVNDSTQFVAQPPMLQFAEDDSLIYAISNWYPFVEDVDNADSTLIFTAFSGASVKAVKKEAAYRFTAPANWFGIDTLLLTASDGTYTDSAWFAVQVHSRNDAPEITGLPEEISFDNDTSYVLTMNEYASDIDTPDSLLSWAFRTGTDSVFLNYDVDKTTLTISAAAGFVGKVTLFCTLKDDSLAEVTDSILVDITPATGLEDDLQTTPQTYALEQNYPNPFNPLTHIKYAVPRAGHVTLTVFDVLGRKVATLVDARKEAGYHVVKFNAGKFSSGVYFYRIQAGKFAQIKKMILLK